MHTRCRTLFLGTGLHRLYQPRRASMRVSPRAPYGWQTSPRVMSTFWTESKICRRGGRAACTSSSQGCLLFPPCGVSSPRCCQSRATYLKAVSGGLDRRELFCLLREARLSSGVMGAVEPNWKSIANGVVTSRLGEFSVSSDAVL